MLRDKGTKNLSELKNFFTTGEKAFFAIYNTFYWWHWFAQNR